MSDQTAPKAETAEILAVTSYPFTWRASTGFTYKPGREELNVGLNRTREGALDRIATYQTFSDRRHRSFLETLFDEDEMATIASTSISFQNGEHVVRGRRFTIKPADIGA